MALVVGRRSPALASYARLLARSALGRRSRSRSPVRRASRSPARVRRSPRKSPARKMRRVSRSRSPRRDRKGRFLVDHVAGYGADNVANYAADGRKKAARKSARKAMRQSLYSEGSPASYFSSCFNANMAGDASKINAMCDMMPQCDFDGVVDGEGNVTGGTGQCLPIMKGDRAKMVTGHIKRLSAQSAYAAAIAQRAAEKQMQKAIAAAARDLPSAAKEQFNKEVQGLMKTPGNITPTKLAEIAQQYQLSKLQSSKIAQAVRAGIQASKA